MHGRLGRIGFFVILLHAVAITVGYAAMGHSGVLDEALTLTLHFGGPMTAAVGGFALLCVVIVTSLALVRSRWRYENWHAVHLFSYAAIILTIPHQFINGSTIATSAARVVVLGGAVGPHGGRLRDVPRPAPPVAAGALRPARGVRHASGRRFCRDRHEGQAPAHPPPFARAVLPVPLPHRRSVGRGAPVFAVARPQRRLATHYGEAARRPLGRGRGCPRRHQGVGRGSARRVPRAHAHRHGTWCLPAPESASRPCSRCSKPRTSRPESAP